MLIKFKNSLERLSIKQDAKVLIAVSGGVDSMVLLDLANKVFSSLSVLHVNYHLRNEESNLDQQLVEKSCADRQIPFYVYDTKPEELSVSKSIQERARNIRYNWFEKKLEELKADYLLTAHHLDDAIETFFLNAMRGSGIDGLASIPEKRGPFIRPMLSFTKMSILEYAVHNQLAYRNDSSNEKNDYDRNYLRNEIIPHLKDRFPRFDQGMELTINQISKTKSNLEDEVKDLIEDFENGCISLNKLKSLSNVHLNFLLHRIGFSETEGDKFMHAIHNKLVGKIFKTKSKQLLIDRESVLIREFEAQKESGEVLIHEETRHIYLPDSFILSSVQSCDVLFGTGKQYFDLDKLSFPLLVRKWKKGDVFRPLGMKGYKKVSDFLIDKKVSRFDKQEVWVMISDNEIAAILGHQISDVFKIGKTTKNAYLVEINKGNE